MAYQYLKEEILKGLSQGKTARELYPLAKNLGYEASYNAFSKYSLRLKKELSVVPQKRTKKEIDAEIPSILLTLLKKRQSIKLIEICNMFRCSPDYMLKIISNLRSEGHEITTDEHRVLLSNIVVSTEVAKMKPLAETEIKFGVASDLHFGSKCCQITAINEFCEVCKNKGIKHIFVPGDILAGYNVYPGQTYDLYAVSAEEQISSALTNLPTGFEWYVLGGNHDYSFLSKGGGCNVINVMASRRKDIHYIGFDDVEIPILNGVDVKLIHPSGGVPYSYSYRLQKNAEQVCYSELTKMAWGSKDRPSVRFILSGHLHIQVQAMFGSIFGAQCGCFEGQTNYLKRKGLYPTIGGYLISATLGSNGLLREFEAKFRVYSEIENDWTNYSHGRDVEQEIKNIRPIFE